MNVSFIVNNTTFKTYSYLLSSQSSYFKGYFITHPPPATFIVPPGISKETVYFFCKYIESSIKAINTQKKNNQISEMVITESSSTNNNLNLKSLKINSNSNNSTNFNNDNNIPNIYFNIPPQNLFNISSNMIPSLFVELHAFLNLYKINELKVKIKNYICSILSQENIWQIQEKAIDLGNESIMDICNKYIYMDHGKRNKKRKFTSSHYYNSSNSSFNLNSISISNYHEVNNNSNMEQQQPLRKVMRGDPKGKNS